MQITSRAGIGWNRAKFEITDCSSVQTAAYQWERPGRREQQRSVGGLRFVEVMLLGDPLENEVSVSEGLELESRGLWREKENLLK